MSNRFVKKGAIKRIELSGGDPENPDWIEIPESLNFGQVMEMSETIKSEDGNKDVDPSRMMEFLASTVIKSWSLKKPNDEDVMEIAPITAETLDELEAALAIEIIELVTKQFNLNREVEGKE